MEYFNPIQTSQSGFAQLHVVCGVLNSHGLSMCTSLLRAPFPRFIPLRSGLQRRFSDSLIIEKLLHSYALVVNVRANQGAMREPKPHLFLDEDSFLHLYETHYAELQRYAMRLLDSEAHAHDAVQDAFLRLWNRKEKVELGAFTRALLFKAVRNLAFNAIRDDHRRQSAIKRMEETALPDNPEAITHSNILKERITAWICELPDRRREAFELSRFDGLRYEEIAQVMGVSPRTVENHIVLALKFLRTRIDAYDAKLS